MKFQLSRVRSIDISTFSNISLAPFTRKSTVNVDAKIFECNLDYTLQRSNKQNGKYTKKPCRDQFF